MRCIILKTLLTPSSSLKSHCSASLQIYLLISLFKIFIYLFGCLGCIESQLQCMGTSLCCVGFSLWCIDRLVVAHRLSIWGTWAWLLQNTWGLSYLTGDQTCIPCFARRTLNHWTTRKVPYYDNYNNNATECFLRECSC